MITILKTLFEWPAGIVVGNLIASALWAAPALAHLHWLQARRHRELTGGTWSPGRSSTSQGLAAAPTTPATLTWDNPDMPRDRRRRLTGG